MRTRQFFRKFHRWVGLIASLWLLLLATTGFLLQHSEQWHLNAKYINNSTILNIYGIGKQFIAFSHNNHQLIQLDKQLIQDDKTTVKLTENVQSAIFHKDNWIVATQNKIFWIDNKGQIIQSLDDLDGLNLPIDKIGTLNQDLIYISQDIIYNIDSKPIKLNTQSTIQWPQINTDKNLKLKAINLTSKNYLTYQQFLFDIHAGITTPSLLNDIAAIALIILSLSGLFLFFRKTKRNRQ